MKEKGIRKRKKVGLALGGGGWKGIAHAGVLKVLEESNIPIDFIAGTSAGALVGGLYSYFGNSKDLEQFILKFGYRDLLKIIADPKLKAGILKGEKFTQYIKTITKDTEMQNLKIPFCAVACDLISGESVYIKDGSVAEAIKASISIPLVFEPTRRNNMYLVDGGLTENVPVKCVKEMGADIVIAINLNSNFFPVSEKDIKSSSGIAMISSRATLDNLAKYEIKDADVLIEPKILKQDMKISPDYFFKFVKEKELIKVGEEEALKSIPKIIKLINS